MSEVPLWGRRFRGIGVEGLGVGVRASVNERQRKKHFTATQKIFCQSTFALFHCTCCKLDASWAPEFQKWPVARGVDSS